MNLIVPKKYQERFDKLEIESDLIDDCKYDCVRDVMLYVEENLANNGLNISSLYTSLKKYSHEDIKYTCKKLNEALFLNGRKLADGITKLELVIEAEQKPKLILTIDSNVDIECDDVEVIEKNSD